MAAHLFNESGQMQEVDIPDIFDVLEGGEDESAVKFLLGFNADDASGITVTTASGEMMNNNGLVQHVFTTSSPLSPPVSVIGSIADKSPQARVIVQIEPPMSDDGMHQHLGGKADKPRKREPVDPSRCIYACESCGKAFTTKFNLKRHINMHCSRSREAGVPIQGPPSASQPSRKNKNKAEDGSDNGDGLIKVRRVSSNSSNSIGSTNAVAATVSSLTKTVTMSSANSYQHHIQQQQEPMTVQLAVNAQGQIVTENRIQQNQIRTIVNKLPVQPLPESAVQIIQSLGGGVVTNSAGGYGTTQRIVRIINAPQIIATQNRAGITTGATVQLQAIPVTSNNLTFPQQPVPFMQQLGTRQIVLASNASNSLTRMAARVADFMPGIAATAIEAQRGAGSCDVIYRPIVSSSSSLTPLHAVVTSSTISSPTGFNDHPPADLFDSEDGDALSVATTTETPTPPPSLNGDRDQVAAHKSQPLLGMMGGSISLNEEKVVVVQQPPQLCPPSGDDDEDEEDEAVLPFSNTASLLPSNRFHGQLTSIPKGWLRKVVTMSKGFQKVFYYNPVGKRFSSQAEIDQYFARLGYSVPMSLFNFELPKLVDEDEEQDDMEEDDLDEASTTNTMGKTVVVKVTSNAKGEATVVALPSGTTIVTRADTTASSSEIASSVASSPTTPTATRTLVSSSPLVTSSSKPSAAVVTTTKMATKTST